MEEMELRFDMYSCYDRTGDGVKFNFRVKYDWQSIVDNDVNAQNFIVEAIGFDDKALRYLNSIDVNVDAWTKKAMDALTRNNNETAQEFFFENIPNEQYNIYSDKRGW
jgi:hypothetical protein